ncbi:unknown [Roseburia sp. CAG:182]|nr:unknown [Roseburia sp. CAG:182]
MGVQDFVPHIADLHQETDKDTEGLPDGAAPLVAVQLSMQVERKIQESI